jgi:hypothetical protein
MNRCVEQQPQSRREMLCGAARGAALGGLTLLSAALILRGNRTADAMPCPVEGAAVQLSPQQHTACAGCAALARCHLPAAAAARTRGKG